MYTNEYLFTIGSSSYQGDIGIKCKSGLIQLHIQFLE